MCCMIVVVRNLCSSDIGEDMNGYSSYDELASLSSLPHEDQKVWLWSNLNARERTGTELWDSRTGNYSRDLLMAFVEEAH